MVNDVTARGPFGERFQTALFPVSSEGRGAALGAALRVYNLTIIARLWLLDV